MTSVQRIDCMKCRHFYVTWDTRFPKGCKAFGFKSLAMPSQTVFTSSGKPCMNFDAKDSSKQSYS